MTQHSIATMNELRYAIVLNNGAVTQAYTTLFVKKASLVAFQNAIHVMRTFSDSVATIFGSPRTSQRQFDFGTHGHDHTCRGRDTDYGFVYNRPLYISASTAARIESRQDLEAAGVTVSATLLFNLALMWHDAGMQTGRDACLHKANNLYHLLATVLAESTVNACDASYHTLQCLLLNNRGHIYYALGDYVQSRRCVDELLGLLLVADHMDYFLQASEAKALKLNVMYFTIPKVALAA